MLKRHKPLILLGIALILWGVLACVFMWVASGCQASTRITGAHAEASSVTTTTRVRTLQSPSPTIRVRIGPRPHPAPEAK